MHSTKKEEQEKLSWWKQDPSEFFNIVGPALKVPGLFLRKYHPQAGSSWGSFLKPNWQWTIVPHKISGSWRSSCSQKALYAALSIKPSHPSIFYHRLTAGVLEQTTTHNHNNPSYMDVYDSNILIGSCHRQILLTCKCRQLRYRLQLILRTELLRRAFEKSYSQEWIVAQCHQNIWQLCCKMEPTG